MSRVCYYCGVDISDFSKFMRHITGHIDKSTSRVVYNGSFECLYKNCKKPFNTYGDMVLHSKTHLRIRKKPLSVSNKYRRPIYIVSKKIDDCITGLILMKNGVRIHKRYSFNPNIWSNDIVAAATIISNLK